MSNYVTDVLSQEVIRNFCQQIGWSSELGSFLSQSQDILYMTILVKYSKLYALDFTDYNSSFISNYLYCNLSNEFEKLFLAMTYQYKPYFNYYRKINEQNSGADENQHTGNDTIKHTGSDKYSGDFHNDVDEKTTTPSESIISSSTYDETNKQQMKPQSMENTTYDIHRDDESTYSDTQIYGKIETQEYGKVLTMNFGRVVDTEIEGINGLTPPQDLIKKEIELRLHNRLFEIFTNMIVKCVSAGIWDCE